jgi:transketolase
MEGISHEAASLAGHLGLGKLIVFYDDNAISIDGSTELAFSDDPLMRFRGYGWAAERIDGHDHQAVADALRRAQESGRPSLIACRTTIAFGAPTKAGSAAAAHGAPLGAAEIAGARAGATVHRGWIMVKSGDAAEGISLLRSGLMSYRAPGQKAWTPYYTALLAEACQSAGQVEEASTLLDDSLRIVEGSEVWWFAAELYRLKGQLRLRQGHPEAAEELYRKALTIAQAQEARLWE